MLAEAVAAALVGMVALWLALRPLLGPPRPPDLVEEPVEQEETPKGVALLALKEIEFDRETGKLSDADYEYLKDKYTAEALEALRAGRGTGVPDDAEALIAHRVRALRSAAATAPPGAPSCPSCGPRPEADAVYCSTCGGRLPAPATCARCGKELSADSRFCEGVRHAAWPPDPRLPLRSEPQPDAHEHASAAHAGPTPHRCPTPRSDCPRARRRSGSPAPPLPTAPEAPADPPLRPAPGSRRPPPEIERRGQRDLDLPLPAAATRRRDAEPRAGSGRPPAVRS